jgi:tRNA (guanine-N7-)-methyltransferase
MSPDAVDWKTLLPDLAPGQQVDFADVGCGFGGLLSTRSLPCLTLLVKLGEKFPDKRSLGMELRDKVAHYVEERILALRVQHEGKYRNIAVARSNAMKCLVNYFKCAQACSNKAISQLARENVFLLPRPSFQTVESSPKDYKVSFSLH